MENGVSFSVKNFDLHLASKSPEKETESVNSLAKSRRECCIYFCVKLYWM
jgi:hypothetical protein